MVALALLGFGVSLAIPSLLTAVVGSASRELAGMAGGALNASRQTGAVLGVAVLGALLNATTTTTSLAVAGAVLLVGMSIAATAYDHVHFLPSFWTIH